MLLLALMVLASSAWATAPSCPAAFNSLNTTIGAITNSTELRLCASKALLVKGANGSLSLVLGSTANSAPSCLVYPNGLNLDLTYDLLSSGHVGCWSLYPPTQAITMVNIGKPNQAKLQAALKTFRPAIPRIFRKPNTSILVGTKISFSSSASRQLTKTKILNLPAQVRFIPIVYKWSFRLGAQQIPASKLPKPAIKPTQVGIMTVDLSVTYSVEYTFPGLVPWTQVTPNLVQNALPINFLVVENPPEILNQPPRLVQGPCSFMSIKWRC